MPPTLSFVCHHTAIVLQHLVQLLTTRWLQELRLQDGCFLWCPLVLEASRYHDTAIPWSVHYILVYTEDKYYNSCLPPMAPTLFSSQDSALFSQLLNKSKKTLIAKHKQQRMNRLKHWAWPLTANWSLMFMISARTKQIKVRILKLATITQNFVIDHPDYPLKNVNIS